MPCEEITLAYVDARMRAEGKKRDYVNVGLTPAQFLERKWRCNTNHWCEIWHARLTLKECRELRDKYMFGHLRGTAARHSEWKETVNRMNACNKCWRKINAEKTPCS